MGKHSAVLLTILILGVHSLGRPDTVAAAQYNCGGRIQFRPCGQPMHSYKRKVVGEDSMRARSKDPSSDIYMTSEEKRPATVGEPFARISKPTYKSLTKGEGLWHGTVAGNGTVHLKLNIERDGELEYSRYMGRIFLRNKSTWFSFKSMQPKGRNWSWNITAFAE
jgi:hypothetical protein